MAVAAMRRKVLAIDMLEENLAFINLSLHEAKLYNFVKLVHNAIR